MVQGKDLLSTAVGNCFEGLDCTPQAVLEQMFGFESFRPGQEEAIESLLNNKDTIAIVPTGGGKTLIYTIPCMMKKGLSVVISPLLILMYDQVARLRQLGVNTCYYNTLLEEQDRKSILHNLQQSDCQYEFVFVSPEAVLTETFLSCLENINTAGMLNYIIIDEAHCIDSWGNDFRPEYGQLGKLKDLLSVPVAALTGTASKMTIEIIRSQLHMKDTSIVRLPCRRNNLTYTILKKPESKVHDFVASYVARHHSNECGIIYCGTQASATQMAFALKEQDLSVTFYHAGMEVSEKLANSNLWFEGSANIVCCTSAFGMGIDKQNVRFVIHLAIPSSPDELLQESGRAGRDGEPASCTIFFRFADRSLHLRHIARTDNPSVQEEALRLLNSLCCMLSDKATCRQQLFSNYFDNEPGAKCETCDICQKTAIPTNNATDLTEETKDLVSCLQQMMLLKPKIKTSELVMTFMGSKAKDVLDNKFNSCEKYGKGSKRFKTARKLTQFLEYLINQNILKENFQAIKDSQYSINITMEGAFEVVSGRQKVFYQL